MTTKTNKMTQNDYVTMKKNQILEDISAQFINGLEEKGLQFFNDWSPNVNSKNGVSGYEYTGLNALALSFNGFADSRYYTFNQAEALKHKVKKGEKSTHLVQKYGQIYDEKEEKFITVRWGEFFAKENEKKKKKIVNRIMYVFNAEQLEGMKLEKEATPKFSDKAVKKIAEAIGVDYVAGSKYKAPCYVPNEHKVYMPSIALFKSQKGMFSTAFHELSHATAKALKRNIYNAFGTKNYAFEELVAEMSSAILCRYFGVNNKVTDNNKAYVKSWVRKLKDDKNAILNAYKLAEQSALYIIASLNGEEFEIRELFEAKEEEPQEEPKKTRKTTKTVKETKTETVKETKKTRKTEKVEDTVKLLETGEYYALGKEGKALFNGYLIENNGRLYGVSKQNINGKKVTTSKYVFTITDIETGLIISNMFNDEITNAKEAIDRLDECSAVLTKMTAKTSDLLKVKRNLLEAPVLA